MKKIIYTSLFLTTLLSCSNDSIDDLLEPIPEGQVISYNNTVKAIIDNNCISCHNSPPINGAPFALINYDNVVLATNNALIDRISRQNGESGAMPLGGPRLPQNLIDAIITWKDEGLLEN